MRFLVVDDHVLLRSGVVRLLGEIEGADILEADGVSTAIQAFRRQKPDVVVLDINLRDGSGLELLRRLKAENPLAKVVVFSMYSDVVYATAALRAGALGYVSKSAPADQLLLAVRRASRGQPYVDTTIAGEIAVSSVSTGESVNRLTARETEILRLLADGRSLSDIALTLGVAYKTVANTCTRIKEKLGIDRTAALIRFALETRQDGGSRMEDLDEAADLSRQD